MIGHLDRSKARRDESECTMGIVLEAKRTESALTSTGPPFVHTRVRGPIGGWGAPRDTVIGSLDCVWVKVCWLGAYDGPMLATHEREDHSLVDGSGPLFLSSGH